jgi:hypothetical protein
MMSRMIVFSQDQTFNIWRVKAQPGSFRQTDIFELFCSQKVPVCRIAGTDPGLQVGVGPAKSRRLERWSILISNCIASLGMPSSG